MISTTSFAEYATGGRRRRTEIVAAQLVAGDVQFYRPILDAIRVAVSVGDLSVLARAVDQAELTGQSRAFAEIADGFVGWWSKARATPIRCGASALRVGDVDLSVVPHLAVRSSAGDQVIMFHFKEQPLEKDAAHAALRILQICMDDLAPGGVGTDGGCPPRQGVPLGPQREPGVRGRLADRFGKRFRLPSAGGFVGLVIGPCPRGRGLITQPGNRPHWSSRCRRSDAARPGLRATRRDRSASRQPLRRPCRRTPASRPHRPTRRSREQVLDSGFIAPACRRP